MSSSSDFSSSSAAETVAGEDASLTDRAQEAFQDAKDAIEERPLTTLLVAGAAGIVLGALIWKVVSRSRNGAGGQLNSLERAIELARSGTVNTVQHLRRTLANEGYSLNQIDGRALKKQLAHLMAEASRLNRAPGAIYDAWKRSQS